MFKRLLILPVAASLAACAEAPAPSAAVSAAAPAAPAAPAAAPDRPAKLGLCVACHGEDGTSRVAGTPHLGGQDRQYLERALSDYRSGQRRHEPMTSLANTLQPADLQALAAWYAAQPGFRAGESR
jgi:cytochrome c553